MSQDLDSVEVVVDGDAAVLLAEVTGVLPVAGSASPVTRVHAGLTLAQFCGE